MGAQGAGVSAQTLSHVALLYYREGLTQGEIARRIGLSRATVVNYLRLARESGIVEIRINGDGFTASRLSHELTRRWSLEAAYVARSDGGTDPAATLAEVAGIAVHSLLSPGDRLGVAWGETVQRVADALPIRAVPGLMVHQMVGSMYDAHLHAAENCTMKIARKCGADCRTLHAPAILSRPDLAEALRAEPIIALQLARFGDLSHALFSVGDTGAGTTLVTSGIAPAEEVARYEKAGARAVLCGHFIDGNGAVMETPLGARLIGITPAQLAAVPVRMLVAAGAGKRAAVRALLVGGYVSHLVIDEASAEALLA